MHRREGRLQQSAADLELRLRGCLGGAEGDLKTCSQPICGPAQCGLWAPRSAAGGGGWEARRGRSVGYTGGRGREKLGQGEREAAVLLCC